MARSLVIVESPAKARTINRYLGKDYLVKSSVGHIRDLPAGGKGKSSRGRGKEAAGGRKATPQGFRRTPRRGRGANSCSAWVSIRIAAGAPPTRSCPARRRWSASSRSWPAPPIRSFSRPTSIAKGKPSPGTSRKVIGGDPTRFRRVVFNEITRRAIRDAFEHSGEIESEPVNAQQARRFLDRVVGFEVSPLLWAKVARGLSAGRVQSVAVRLVVDREREIRAFEPEEYWEVFADLTRAGGRESCRFQVARSDGRAFRPHNKREADDALAHLRQEAFTVARVENKPTATRPGRPSSPRRCSRPPRPASASGCARR